MTGISRLAHGVFVSQIAELLTTSSDWTQNDRDETDYVPPHSTFHEYRRTPGKGCVFSNATMSASWRTIAILSIRDPWTLRCGVRRFNPL